MEFPLILSILMYDPVTEERPRVKSVASAIAIDTATIRSYTITVAITDLQGPAVDREYPSSG